MHIYEFEAKKILKEYGINIPTQFGFYRSISSLPDNLNYPLVAKVQVLEGQRGRRGGVQVINSVQELESFYRQVVNRKFKDQKAIGLLVEEQIQAGHDIYFSLAYNNFGPILIINQQGGVDIEESKYSSLIISLDINTKKITRPQKDSITAELKLNNRSAERFLIFLKNLIKCFFEENCRLIEINPVRFYQSKYFALDIKMILDSRAVLTSRVLESKKIDTKSEREKLVAQINSHPEYRGSPCSYVDLYGDAGLLLSGGGASLIVLDALVKAKIKPANYSEYSGNPKAEKVEALTKIVLSQPKLKGLLIAGGVANFTLIDETMKGVARALEQIKPNYPIVIRRGGPNEDKGKKIMLNLAKKYNLNITWLGSEKSLTQACQFFINKIN